MINILHLITFRGKNMFKICLTVWVDMYFDHQTKRHLYHNYMLYKVILNIYIFRLIRQ